MTDLITEARELCEKTTPGPWTWRDVTDDSKYFLSAKDLVSEDSLIISAEDIYPGYPECGQDLVLNLSTDDAAFIARSRTLIPELCDALESYKSFADQIAKLPDCNDCASNRDCPYLPNWGTTTRINCPLHKPLPAPPEEEGAEHERD